MFKRVLFLSFLVLFIDQLTKILIKNNLLLYESILVIRNLFYITYIENYGAAFNFFYGNRWFLVIFSFLALYIIIKYFIFNNNINKVEVIGFGLLIGGILGNLFDRIVYGYVIDFLDLFIFGYNFPVFNVADMGIVFGTIIIVFNTIQEEK